MKKNKLKIIVIVFLLLLSMLLSACGKQNSSHESESVEDESHRSMRIALSATDYTYDTLIDDIIKYFRFESNGKFYFSSAPYSDKSKYLSQNISVEKLINKTFIEKAQSAGIDDFFIYHLAMLFPDSWEEHKKLVVWDDIYKVYYPLF